ncbi:NAD(P)H-dependent oxidoreductase [Bacillus sp. NPDC077027]|uniref:NAD(P)H-dependent oxidoreductase n=1 Tax=Bacillus sp. NPDC077027 TaxID=3390548 RepID=UPI003D026CA0
MSNQAKKAILICGSYKPSKEKKTASATRSYLNLLASAIEKESKDSCIIYDIRESNLPFYDGRMPHEYNNEYLDKLYLDINENDLIVIALPSYWSTISGGIINLINLLTGPLYDKEDEYTIFKEKIIIPIIVGAQYRDAEEASKQVELIFSSLSVKEITQPIKIGNVREMEGSEKIEISKKIYRIGKIIGNNMGRASL